jgi:hypothetical protein
MSSLTSVITVNDAEYETFQGWVAIGLPYIADIEIDLGELDELFAPRVESRFGGEPPEEINEQLRSPGCIPVPYLYMEAAQAMMANYSYTPEFSAWIAEHSL